VLFLTFISLSLQALPPVPSAREDAMGDSHPVLADDFATVFSNPAGIAVIQPVHRFAGIDMRFSGTFWKIINVFEGENPIRLFPFDEGTYLGFGLLGPVDVGYAGNGEAFRLFSYSSLDVLYPNVAVQSHFTFRIGAEFTGGRAHRFQLGRGVTLDLGVTMKGIYEQRYLGEADVVEFLGLLINPDYFLDFPHEVVPGIGLDAGTIVRFGKQWAVGLNVEDLFTLEFVNHYNTLRSAREGNGPDVKETRIRLPEISIGGGWFPSFTDDIPWLGFNGLYLSFRHLLGGLEIYPVDYLLGITAGIELTFWDFMALRAGFSEGLPDVGLGFKFGGFSLDLAVGGDELTNQPGVFSVVDFRVAIAFQSKM
ncbi:MAG: hypothetical protein KAH21_01975, partial [Spirochaetaceae bacterium]|nr:hypothetical protein [Spirochaetaceae bacterium]